ncbi:hypothetical protein [Candidatus Uabimicrobium amorphum]|uniref:Uncharacterized protein n=1 Tax=Uabimicrobium amorphum TaxID=2596890 RepID=A0A5S9IIZ0_UABAM|nr:hypothetical protein [Candidatus Uabimicrobium amorphum]BBM82703.1 hypothetical protein UABAM_01046 [Candidatus Uabimicrobium amorphum]
MRLVLLILVMLPCFANQSYIYVEKNEWEFLAEISRGEQQVILAQVRINGKNVHDAQVWVNGILLQKKLALNAQPSSKQSFSQLQLSLPLYNVVTRDLTAANVDVVVEYLGETREFKNIIPVPAVKEQQPQVIKEEPTADPLTLDFEDIAIPLGGGIKVIHIKIYDLTQIEYHGIVRIRGKTKKYNPFCLFAVGSIDYSGKVSALAYYHSFKGNRYLETAVEMDGYAPVVLVHTGLRYRFAKYASSKIKRVLVNKASAPIKNVRLALSYRLNEKNYNHTMKIGDFKNMVIDLNTHYPHNPVLGRTTPALAETLEKQELKFPERAEELPKITIINTSNDVAQDIKIQVLYSSGKGNQSKDVDFDVAGNEEVIIE